MNTSMIAASVTMGQLQKKLDTISHNLANVNTQGFKRREASFSDLLFQQVNNQTMPVHEVGRLTPNGIRVGAGAKVAQTALRIEQGSIQQTERSLDVAIDGRGHFFQVLTEEGGQLVTRYTRDGAFYLSQNQNNPDVLNLVTSNGSFVVGTNGPITIPANYSEIQIGKNGTISVTMQNGAVQQLGALELVNVARPQMLEQVGDNQFALRDNVVDLGYVPADIVLVLPQQNVSVQQGALEMSNVDMSREMSEMLLAQRSYQFNSRSITMADQMMGLVNGIR